MQRSPKLSQARQKLIELSQSPVADLTPFLSGEPLVKGTVYPLRRKCSKPSCRCARGELHQTVVLTASVGGKTRLWTIPPERMEEIRQGTERYRQFRRARVQLLKEYGRRQEDILNLINAIEKALIRQP